MEDGGNVGEDDNDNGGGDGDDDDENEIEEEVNHPDTLECVNCLESHTEKDDTMLLCHDVKCRCAAHCSCA